MASDSIELIFEKENAMLQRAGNLGTA
jgi:hypothetical protein